MISINNKNKEKCCGCTACMNICPVNAIKMQEDDEGFLYPVVNKNKCINCNLCEKHCPIIDVKESKELPVIFATRINNDNILKNSTSGGFFTPIANYVLNKDGVIIGVSYNKNFRVEHIKITKNNAECLSSTRGSKYVQSYLGNIFTEIKKFLEDGKTVLFTGTPCQVQGLKKFLSKDYINLITMDFVCRGVASPKIWSLYIKYQENKNKIKLKQACFRNKTYGYHSGTMKLVFKNNKEYYGSARVDYMLKSFFEGLSIRPSCFECSFKSKKHTSDFTSFECWHAQELVKGLKDDDKGYTNVMVNTEKAKKILDSLGNEIQKYEVDLEKAIKLDGPMVENCAIPNDCRSQFFNRINQNGFENTMKKYVKVSSLDKLIENSKKHLYKTNIYSKLTRLRK